MTRLFPASATKRLPRCTAMPCGHRMPIGPVRARHFHRAFRSRFDRARDRQACRSSSGSSSISERAGCQYRRRRVLPDDGDAIAPVERVAAWLMPVPRLARPPLKSAWPKHDIGRLIGSRRIPVPDQYAVVPGIGDRKYASARRYARRHIECRRTDGTLAVSAFGIEVRLANEEVGGCAIQCGHVVPNQQPMVARIADEERAISLPSTAPRGPNSEFGARPYRFRQSIGSRVSVRASRERLSEFKRGERIRRRPQASSFERGSARRASWRWQPHFDTIADDANGMGLELHRRRRQAFATCKVVAEAVIGAGDDAVLDFAVVERQAEMRAGVLEARHD